MRVVGHQVTRVSHHVGTRRRSRAGAGVQVVQRVGCSTWTPAPALLRASSPTRRYTRFRPSPVMRSDEARACCWRAISPGQPRSRARSRDPGLPQVDAPDHTGENCVRLDYTLPLVIISTIQK
jgi:hypothetical protein